MTAKPDYRGADPTRGEEKRSTVLAKLADGQRATAFSYENVLTVLEQTLDHVATLCELLHRQRAALDHLQAQARAYDARLAPVSRVVTRARFIEKLNKARHDLGELINA
jgi:hypothetical protein